MITASIGLIIIVMLMFLALVVAAVAIGVWALSRSGVLGGTAEEHTVEPMPLPEDDALDIVRGRYARGEITYDEYSKLRNDLET